jgi:hypothetical protein
MQRSIVEIAMTRIAILMGVTALVSFSAGAWTKSTLATSALAVQTHALATISPADMHRQLSVDQLPIQQIDSLY